MSSTPHRPRGRTIRAALAILAAVLVAAGFALGNVVGDDSSTGPSPSPTPTATVATPSPTPAAAPAGDLQGKPSDLRDSTPDDVPQAKLEAGKDKAEQLADQADLPEQPIKTGGAQLNPCRVSYQSRGFGSFRSRVLLFVLHYTVSGNVPGWGDVLAIKAYLNRVGLSATFIMDFEGHCLQTVPADKNPYTQGFYNGVSESVEIIATGKETRAQWLAAPIIKDGVLARLAYSRLKARKLPIRFVDPAGCNPKLGYTDHNHLECNNDHYDVSPAFPFDVFARQLKALNSGVRPITARDRSDCRLVHAYRDRRRAGARKTKTGTAAFERRLKRVRSHGLRCVDGKVKRR